MFGRLESDQAGVSEEELGIIYAIFACWVAAAADATELDGTECGNNRALDILNWRVLHNGPVTRAH